MFRQERLFQKGKRKGEYVHLTYTMCELAFLEKECFQAYQNDDSGDFDSEQEVSFIAGFVLGYRNAMARGKRRIPIWIFAWEK